MTAVSFIVPPLRAEYIRAPRSRQLHGLAGARAYSLHILELRKGGTCSESDLRPQIWLVGFLGEEPVTAILFPLVQSRRPSSKTAFCTPWDRRVSSRAVLAINRRAAKTGRPAMGEKKPARPLPRDDAQASSPGASITTKRRLPVRSSLFAFPLCAFILLNPAHRLVINKSSPCRSGGMADAPDSKSGGVHPREGSSPSSGTTILDSCSFCT